jgi:hypothetical protein
MIEIPQAQFGRLAPLFGPDPLHATMIYSALDGRTPACAYVDDAGAPAQCLLVTNFLNFIFYGMDPERAPDSAWLAHAISTLRRTQEFYLNWPARPTAQGEPPVLPDRVQGGLEFRDRRPPPVPLVPSDHHLQLVDGGLFARCLWHDDMVTAAGTAENFLCQGIGLCLMAGDEIRSEAYAVCLGAGRFEIGIVTAEAHRGRGYAFIVCQHLMRLCDAAGRPPSWGCFADNTASANLARKLGYQTELADQWYYYARAAPAQ